MSSTPAAESKSGIITSTSGDRHIPSSVRADGSTRKEIRIRPGYKPPEDIEVYKNRTAEAWKTRGADAGVPGAAPLDEDTTKSGSNKNTKRREARRRAKASGQGGQMEQDSTDQNPSNDVPHEQSASVKKTDTTKDNWRAQEQTIELTPNPEVEKEKQARNLKKKLRQARELREKKEKGGSLLPEQFEKVIKINELIRQLSALGFDADGERKEE
ncbi:MAG: hypothetical protein Q9190_004023 [Brigantiaea leucoxantha]